ncbi:hypothetical protein R4E93_07815 [Bacteroides ovatus]|jgi:hypothetical protein|uniref:hypothetical protein n=1 Tax=Bacteroides ovatus TaxID=28116 RepID=UPI002954B1BD|nr:hypothetical protein [Bacteroides ovatus]MDV7051557.1 hypothetical protein [Bacteroides ovatus]
MNESLSWSAIIAFFIFIAQQIFKTRLDYRKYRSEVVFSKLHQERAEVVKQIFQKLTILQQTLIDFTRATQITHGNETYEEHQRKLFQLFEESYVEARNYTTLNKIYLSNELCAKIDNLISKIRHSAIDYNFLNKDIREDIAMRDNQLIKEKYERCRSIRDKVEVEMQGLLNDLEVEFRQLLGGDKISRWQKLRHQLMRLYNYL